MSAEERDLFIDLRPLQLVLHGIRNKRKALSSHVETNESWLVLKLPCLVCSYISRIDFCLDSVALFVSQGATLFFGW
jgi:hypothetical protein